MPFKKVLLFSPAGLRIGKGEGFADLEYGMMALMGAVDESTVVVTVVHDCQVSFLFHQSSEHDVVSWNFYYFLYLVQYR